MYYIKTMETYYVNWKEYTADKDLSVKRIK